MPCLYPQVDEVALQPPEGAITLPLKGWGGLTIPIVFDERKRSLIDGCILRMVAKECRQGNGEAPLRLTLGSFFQAIPFCDS